MKFAHIGLISKYEKIKKSYQSQHITAASLNFTAIHEFSFKSRPNIKLGTFSKLKIWTLCGSACFYNLIIYIYPQVFVVQLLVFSTTGQLLKNIPPDFQPILSKIIAQREKVKIAKATDSLQVEGHKAIARVIKHTDTDSPVARTVIKQNSPEAHKALVSETLQRKS